jgi:hypothetical protein
MVSGDAAADAYADAKTVQATFPETDAAAAAIL